MNPESDKLDREKKLEYVENTLLHVYSEISYAIRQLERFGDQTRALDALHRAHEACLWIESDDEETGIFPP